MDNFSGDGNKGRNLQPLGQVRSPLAASVASMSPPEKCINSLTVIERPTGALVVGKFLKCKEKNRARRKKYEKDEGNTRDFS